MAGRVRSGDISTSTKWIYGKIRIRIKFHSLNIGNELLDSLYFFFFQNHRDRGNSSSLVIRELSRIRSIAVGMQSRMATRRWELDSSRRNFLEPLLCALIIAGLIIVSTNTRTSSRVEPTYANTSMHGLWCVNIYFLVFLRRWLATTNEHKYFALRTIVEWPTPRKEDSRLIETLDFVVGLNHLHRETEYFTRSFSTVSSSLLMYWCTFVHL